MDRRKVKVINMVYPGEHIIVNHNGTRYEIEDKATVSLPGGVISVLYDAKVKRHKRVVGKNEMPESWFQKYEVIELEEPDKTSTETQTQKSRNKLAEELRA